MIFSILKKYCGFIVIFFSMFLYTQKVYSQLSREEIIGAYVYNFAKNIEIEKEKKLETYNIALITKNLGLINEFRNIEKRLKVNDKEIKVNVKENSNFDFVDICIIFIAEDKSSTLSEIFSKTQKEQVLIVSENYQNKRKVMINLYDTNEEKILFEVNKENLYTRKINISNELLLMGGTVIDVFELYVKSQELLKESEKDYKFLQSKIKKTNKQYADIQQSAEFKERKINEQIEIIKKQKKEQEMLLLAIEETKKELEQHRLEIYKQKNMLDDEKNKLQPFSDSLKNSKILLEKQKKELNEDIHKLSLLKNEIRTKNREVKVQESTLGEQYEKINKQEKINNLFMIIIFLGIILTAGLLIGFIYRKNKNNLLNEQKEELRQKNETIADHLEKKKLINNLLKEKNEELSSIIDELKNAQQQLIQAEKMASLGILTAGIAHEINNPINFIYTGINSLQKDFKDIEVIINKYKSLSPEVDDLKLKILEIQALKKEYYFDEAVEAIPQTMVDIKIGAERTAEIVDGLRKFSRMDENKFIRSDIHEYIQTALLILKSKYKHNINIVRNYDENLPDVFCNPGKITQVFMNIIYNAVDAINEKENIEGEIIITTKYKNDNIEISIKDNGIGIKEGVKKKMFDPFFTTKDVGKGTGLGLAISFGIIEEHKGKIDVQSEIGKGTEFIINLPVKN